MDKYERVAMYLRGVERQFADAAGEEGTPDRGVWVTAWSADLDVTTEYRVHDADVDMFHRLAENYTDEELTELNHQFKKDY